MIQLGVLGSTQGTVLSSLVEAIHQKKLNANIKLILSNKSNAGILERAQNFNLPAEFIDPINLSRESYDKKISEKLSQHKIDLIVLIGYMRILSDSFISAWRNKIINVHPSLLPAFAGKMDKDVHQAVLQSGVKETGCTVHVVTENVDNGPILIQKTCKVFVNDTIEQLKSRVQRLEGQALVEAINMKALHYPT